MAIDLAKSPYSWLIHRHNGVNAFRRSQFEHLHFALHRDAISIEVYDLKFMPRERNAVQQTGLRRRPLC